MTAFSQQVGVSKSIPRALEEALTFEAKGVVIHDSPERAAYEYAYWVFFSGRPPAWFPSDFRYGYVG
jgi:hypothetical protein